MNKEQVNSSIGAGLSAVTRTQYDRLADLLAERVGTGSCPVIGINGPQGSGKSTLATYLCRRMAMTRGLRAVVLSIDDCYLSHARRAHLADTVHPLLATRGVPGTHDVERGKALISQLCSLGACQQLRIPVFSKAEDDLLAEDLWPYVTGPVDLILFEGWCVGMSPQAGDDLMRPVNELEAEEDPHGVWRRYVNDQLAGPYAEWFSVLDALVYIQIPGFEYVGLWRGQQEQESRLHSHSSGSGLMDTEGLARFIQHYERLTRHAMAVLPERADYLLDLDSCHEVTGLIHRE